MEIKRDIIEKLKAWKENPRRKPLVLQGARQVGKSWALKKFGKECFEDIVYINFDTMPALKEDFRRTAYLPIQDTPYKHLSIADVSPPAQP